MIVVDRIEGEYAICHNGENTFSLPLHLIPEDAHEGACLEERDGEYYINAAAEQERRAVLSARLAAIFDEED